MWLFLDVGYYSVVASPRNLPKLTVRARAAEDLDRLREEYLPELGPTISTPEGDYAFRALVTREDFEAGLGRFVQQLDYSNFKDRVSAKQGKRRSNLYMRIWSELVGWFKTGIYSFWSSYDDTPKDSGLTATQRGYYPGVEVGIVGGDYIGETGTVVEVYHDVLKVQLEGWGGDVRIVPLRDVRPVF